MSLILILIITGRNGTGLCHPLDIVNPAFVASIISSVTELQIVYPDIKDILANEQCSFPNVQPLHTAVQQLSEFDKQISVKSLLRIKAAQILKLQHILYRKVREWKMAKFLKSIESDNITLAIVGSDSTSFGSAWVEAVPKATAFAMAPPEFRTTTRNRLFIPHLKIVPNSKCSCKGN